MSFPAQWIIILVASQCSSIAMISFNARALDNLTTPTLPIDLTLKWGHSNDPSRGLDCWNTLSTERLDVVVDEVWSLEAYSESQC
ncbi:hypothetical protein BJX64DRAFT_262297 [Aspergillus heterothallicus]